MSLVMAFVILVIASHGSGHGSYGSSHGLLRLWLWSIVALVITL